MSSPINTNASAQCSAVFDLSLVQNVNVTKPSRNSSKRLDSSESPVESVSSSATTTTATAVYDDDESAVSLSTLGSANSPKLPPRRSIFSYFWKKTGQVPAELMRREQLSTNPIPSAITAPSLVDTVVPEQSVCEESQISIVSPQAPKVSENDESRPSPMTRTASRRSFMPKNRSESLPLMPKASSSNLAISPRSPRRIVSSSALDDQKKRRSCLREPRFSITSPRSGSSNNEDPNEAAYSSHLSSSFRSACSLSSSVRFDLDAVDVRHYELPREQFAEDGWTTYFH